MPRPTILEPFDAEIRALWAANHTIDEIWNHLVTELNAPGRYQSEPLSPC
jgi:hypothetical protein